MTPETSEWLSNRVPAFVELPDEEKNAIIDFSFLWSLFEGTIMAGKCSPPIIREYVEGLVKQDAVQSLDYESYLDYLKSRYYIDGKVTIFFNGLHIERSGSPEEVMESLSNEAATTEVKIIGCLIVVYRLRNNLFHGEKWQYQLKGQFNNFLQANRFIKCLLEL